MINHQTLSFQHNMEPGTAKPLPLRRDFSETLTQNDIVNVLWLISVHRGGNVDQQASFSLA
jgi:hypothetical protein